MAWWLRATNSNSGASDQQSVGSSPIRDSYVLLKKDINHDAIRWMGHKAIGRVYRT